MLSSKCPAQRQLHDEGEIPRKLALARALWRQSVPLYGTPAENYLRVERKIRGELSSNLRYLASTDRYPPRLVSAFGLPRESEPGTLRSLRPSEISGLSLTYLTENGRKAAGNSKLMLGPSSGFPIVLAPITDLCGLGVTEGIEEALTLHIATGLGVWAAGSASRLPSLAAIVPSYVESVTISVDDDPAGRRHSAALEEALLERGFEVRLIGVLEGVWQ
jgi:hypothetical protein